MVSYLSAVRLFNRNVHLFLLTWGLIAFAYFGIQGVLFNLYLLRLGFNPEFIGLLNGAELLTWAICALPSGAAGSRFGTRHMMLVGVLVIAAGQFLLLLVENLPATMRATWLVGCWMFTWAGAALFVVNSVPFLMASTQPEQRRYAFPFQQATGALMAFAGSLVAGALPGLFASWNNFSLEQPAPYRYTLWLVPAIQALAFVALLFTKKVTEVDRHTGVATQTARAPVRLIALLSLISLLHASAEGITRTFFNVYLDAGLGVPTIQIGTTLALAQLITVLAALTAPLLIGGWGAGRTYAWVVLSRALCLLVLALIPTITAASLGYVGVMLSVAIVVSAANIFNQESVQPRWRALMSGASILGTGAGQSIVAFAGGYVIVSFGYSAIFLMGVALCVAAAILLLVHLRSRRDSAAGAPAAVAVVSQEQSA